MAGPGGTAGLGGVVTATGVISASRVMYHSAEKVLLSSKPSPGLRMSRGSSGTWACSISSAKVRVAKLDKCFPDTWAVLQGIVLRQKKRDRVV